MPTNTWIAAGAGQASNGANWSLGRAPITGDTVVFDATSVNNCSWDLDGLTIVPDSEALATGYSGTVALASDMMSGAGGLQVQAGVLNGGGKWVKSQGNVRHTGGTLATSTPHIEMQSNGTTLQLSANDKIGQLKFTGQNVNFQAPAGGCEVDAAFTNNGSVNLSGLFHLPPHLLSSSTVGNISGTGKLSFRFYNTNATLPAMNVSCNLAIWLLGIGTQNTVATMGGALTCKDLEIYSSHATYTITLNHGSNYQLQVAGAFVLGTRGAAVQGTGAWSFGSYTQNGVSSSFTQGLAQLDIGSGGFAQSDGTFVGSGTIANKIVCAGAFVKSGGAMTNGKVSLVMTGTGNLNVQNITLIYLSVQGTVVSTSSSWWAITDTGALIVAGSLALSGASNVLVAYCPTAITITGAVSGTGTLGLNYNNVASGVLSPISNASVTCNVRIYSSSTKTATLGAKMVLGGSLLVDNTGAFDMILDLNGYSLQARGITAGARGSILFKSGKVVNYGNLDTSAGSVDFGTSQYVQAAPGTIKTAANQPFNDLIVRSGAAGSSRLSDIVINGIYAHVPPTSSSAFAITFDPLKEYTGKRRPVKKQLRKAIVWPSLADKMLLEDLEVPA